MSVQVSDLESRLQELESQSAFQDELIHKLNDIVARQDSEILELKNHLKHLAQRMQDMRDSAPAAGDPAGEVPPHY